MGGTITTAEAAARLGVTERRVRVLLKQRRIPGAKRIGLRWFIPERFTVTEGLPGRPRRR